MQLHRHYCVSIPSLLKQCEENHKLRSVAYQPLENHKYCRESLLKTLVASSIRQNHSHASKFQVRNLTGAPSRSSVPWPICLTSNRDMYDREPVCLLEKRSLWWDHALYRIEEQQSKYIRHTASLIRVISYCGWLSYRLCQSALSIVPKKWFQNT